MTTDLSGDDAAMALVREPDGRLVAAGVTRRGGAGDFALVRYDGDGALDGTFGAGGAMTTDFGGDDVANGLLLTPAGDIVAVGSTSAGTGGSFALAQYTAAGILDDAFGSGGTVTTGSATRRRVAAGDTPRPTRAAPRSRGRRPRRRARRPRLARATTLRRGRSGPRRRRRPPRPPLTLWRKVNRTDRPRDGGRGSAPSSARR